ncbi:MAG: AMP-binding protein [Pseudomonadota bacterium]
MSRALVPWNGDWDVARAAFRWNIPETFNIAERCCDSWARHAPDRVALIVPDGRDWTYGALKEASDRFANVLRAQGIRAGDRVAVLLPQAPEVMITHFAAMKLGAISLPLFTLFGTDALAYRLADSGAKAVVTHREGIEKLEAIRDQTPDLKAVFSIESAAAPIRAFWFDIEAASPDLTPVTTQAEDPAMMIYTSGTTGDPKGVLHAHRFLLGHLPCVEMHHEGLPQPGDLGWTPADWAWIGGLMDLAMPCLYYGIPQVVTRMRKFDPEAAFDLIGRCKIRNMFLPPTALKLMQQVAVPDGVDIRSIGSGGESLGADLLAWGREVLGAPINELYGQTECNLVVTSRAGARVLRPGMMGKAVPGHDVAVIDDQGAPVPDGQEGEIAVRRGSASMFLKYWNKPEKTAEKFTGDWMRTGDLGSRDSDGYFRYASRDDDVITSAGYRIGPTEIETCLTSHPDVIMAAVVGEPDPLRTEIVVAYVVLRDGAKWSGLAETLTDRVRRHVSPHVAPRRIERRESLPMTATGKIMRRALRKG